MGANVVKSNQDTSLGQMVNHIRARPDLSQSLRLISKARDNTMALDPHLAGRASYDFWCRLHRKSWRTARYRIRLLLDFELAATTRLAGSKLADSGVSQLFVGSCLCNEVRCLTWQGTLLVDDIRACACCSTAGYGRLTTSQ